MRWIDFHTQVFCREMATTWMLLYWRVLEIICRLVLVYTKGSSACSAALSERNGSKRLCRLSPKSLGLPVITSHLKLFYFHLNRVDLHFGDSPPWQSVINTNFMKASRYLKYELVVKFFNSNFLKQISDFWMTNSMSTCIILFTWLVLINCRDKNE